jgi:hypothetical protein
LTLRRSRRRRIRLPDSTTANRETPDARIPRVTNVSRANAGVPQRARILDAPACNHQQLSERLPRPHDRRQSSHLRSLNSCCPPRERHRSPTGRTRRPSRCRPQSRGCTVPMGYFVWCNVTGSNTRRAELRITRSRTKVVAHNRNVVNNKVTGFTLSGATVRFRLNVIEL